MSWFDTAGFATLAKSALKEAQKTIDKALDIQEEDAAKSKQSSVTSPSNSSDVSFFSAWGVEGTSTSSQSSPGALPKEPTNKMTNSASLWGSFTGSFFENQQGNKSMDIPSPESQSKQPSVESVAIQPKKTNPPRSLSLDLSTSVRQSKPSTSVNAAGDSQLPTESPSKTAEDPDGEQIREEIKNFPQYEVVMRRKEPKNVTNRLSVISSESDRRSTDSCEVLGSTSTPDSDPTSMSNSSSVAKLRQSGSFESVEVLTSPSSVDVLGSNSTPTSPSDPKRSSESVSPIAESDGVEALREDDDEVSVEDSYTSASETTLTMTVLEHSNIMLKSTSSLDTSFSEVMSPRESRQQLGVILTHAAQGQIAEPNLVPSLSASSSTISTSSSTMAASTSILSPEPLDKSTGQSSGRKEKPLGVHSLPGGPQPHDVVVTEAPKLSVPSPRVSESLSDQEAAQTETSSCDEGTIMGSSDEGGNLSNVTRSQVSNMIADAMTEPPNIVREQSPISSERSDLVKIGSSEHTSGDELETATSSDIEIISSPTPNGSSTASRQSPTKSSSTRGTNMSKALSVSGKVKGHKREPSETSSGGSDECHEVDKLLKKISEITEVLEARESKLIDLSRINTDLNDSIATLKHQIEQQNEAQEMKNMSDEFTQRLAALEKKFQQAIREKDQLRTQLDQAKSLAAEREQDVDKDQLIIELRCEGEKLSKQQLVLNNTIKKLRTTEKDNNKAIASLKDQLANTIQELERSKKAMSAKEEMERSHIEAVHNLTKQVASLEKELAQAKTNVSSLTSSVVSVQKEMQEKEESYKKTEEKIRAERNDLESKVRAEFASELEATQQQSLSFQVALEDLSRQLVTAQKQHSKAEMSLRREVSDMRARAESSERKLDEALEAARLASQPLTTQLQAQAVAHEQAQSQWERQEAILNSTISQLESRNESLIASERSVREQHEASSARISSLSDKVSGLMQQNESLLEELNSNRDSLEKLKVLKNSELKKYQTEKDRLTAELDNKKRELTSLKEVLTIERAALEAEKRKTQALQEQLRVSRSQDGSSPVPQQPVSPPPSPTLSFGGASFSESLSSQIWPNFSDDMETNSNSGRFYDGLRIGNNSSFIETLQSQLKLREGEVQRLQWEVARLESERNALRDEVATMSSRLELQNEDVKSLALLKTQYDALLQMYGEKLEESQELRMDLQDMKDMYKAQIEELLKKNAPSSSPPT
uniref:TATA element modulatory factor n=1 Tax=Lygus hesperus TaxID=30085 RepID=A0A0A9YHY5_LYGHE